MIFPALITHSLKHSTAATLYPQLERLRGLCPQCWVLDSHYPWEEKLPQHPALLSLAEQTALAHLMGSSAYPECSYPLAPSRKLQEQLSHCDIIHLHTLKGNTLSLKALSKLYKPLLLELEDDYPLTALCSDKDKCQAYTQECNQCPKTRFPRLAHYLFRRKAKNYRQMEGLQLVAPTRHKKKEAEASPLFHGRKIHIIKRAIDCEHYQALHKAESKARFHIPAHHRVIGFRCSTKINPREAQLIDEICQILFQQNILSLSLILLGEKALTKNIPRSTCHPYPALYITEQQEEKCEKAQIYSAIDILVHLTGQNKHDKDCLEAMACEVPQINYIAQGVEEYLQDSQSGIQLQVGQAAPAYQVSEAIKELLHKPLLRTHYGLHGRDYITTQHESGHIAAQYKQVYLELCREQGRK